MSDDLSSKKAKTLGLTDRLTAQICVVVNGPLRDYLGTRDYFYLVVLLYYSSITVLYNLLWSTAVCDKEMKRGRRRTSPISKFTIISPVPNFALY